MKTCTRTCIVERPWYNLFMGLRVGVSECIGSLRPRFAETPHVFCVSVFRKPSVLLVSMKIKVTAYEEVQSDDIRYG